MWEDYYSLRGVVFDFVSMAGFVTCPCESSFMIFSGSCLPVYINTFKQLDSKEKWFCGILIFLGLVWRLSGLTIWKGEKRRKKLHF